MICCAYMHLWSYDLWRDRICTSFTSDKGGGICDYPWCLSVCLSVSKVTQKCVHGFEWNFACRQVSGHGWTGQLLCPIRILVRMLEPENLKVEDLSKSVKQAPHSEQATGHGMHCRKILFTPCCSPRAKEFPGSVDFSVRRMVAELRGVKLAQFSDIGLCRRYMRSLHQVPF